MILTVAHIAMKATIADPRPGADEASNEEFGLVWEL